MTRQQASSRAAQAVLAAQHRFWSALQSKDATFFDEVLADDFISCAPGEPEQDRAAFITTLTSFPGTVLAVGSDDLAVHFVGSVAVVTGIQQARLALPNGQEVMSEIAITNVFVPAAEGWRMALAHPVELGPRTGESR
jgi:ketosteroid isomerase-like protein